MNHQALFSSKDKSEKKIKVSSAASFICALMLDRFLSSKTTAKI